MGSASASSHGQAQQGVTDVLMENTGLDFETFYTWASNGWPLVATLEKKRTSPKTGDVDVFYVQEQHKIAIHLLECSTMIIQTVWRLHRQQAARVYKAVAVAMLAGTIGKEAIVMLECLHWTPSVGAWVMPKR